MATIVLIVLSVDAQTGAVVLYHAVNSSGVVDGSPEVSVGLGTHLLRRASIPDIRVSEDGALRFPRLGEEEPMPPCLSKVSIAAVQRFDNRHAVEDGKARDDVRVAIAVRNAV